MYKKIMFAVCLMMSSFCSGTETPSVNITKQRFIRYETINNLNQSLGIKLTTADFTKKGLEELDLRGKSSTQDFFLTLENLPSLIAGSGFLFNTTRFNEIRDAVQARHDTLAFDATVTPEELEDHCAILSRVLQKTINATSLTLPGKQTVMQRGKAPEVILRELFLCTANDDDAMLMTVFNNLQEAQRLQTAYFLYRLHIIEITPAREIDVLSAKYREKLFRLFRSDVPLEKTSVAKSFLAKENVAPTDLQDRLLYTTLMNIIVPEESIIQALDQINRDFGYRLINNDLTTEGQQLLAQSDGINSLLNRAPATLKTVFTNAAIVQLLQARYYEKQLQDKGLSINDSTLLTSEWCAKIHTLLTQDVEDYSPKDIAHSLLVGRKEQYIKPTDYSVIKAKSIKQFNMLFESIVPQEALAEICSRLSGSIFLIKLKPEDLTPFGKQIVMQTDKTDTELLINLFKEKQSDTEPCI
jgi:predicted regulator of amino acid metabolism with ACT domain